MTRPLRVLIIDDSADDVFLVKRTLSSHGFEFASTSVSNLSAMLTELERHEWDLVLSDHYMPGLDAAAALELVKRLHPDVPFIIVSGQIDLNLAVALIKAGAQDYVKKSELVRLGPVVDRELADARLRAERTDAEHKLRESEERFRAIVENVGDLVVTLDTEGKRLYNSPSYKGFFTEEEIPIGSDSFSEIHPEDRERIKATFRRTVTTGIGERAEFRFLLKDGSIRHIESEGRAIHDVHGNVTKVIVVSRDITERKHMEADLREMATTDFLSGLPNRRHFVTRLEEELSRMLRLKDQCAAVLMLDVDHFKRVNDRFGHATGDNLLRHLGELIRSELRRTDTAGRVGGEEFAIILPGASIASARNFADRLRLKVLTTPLKTGDISIDLTISIGAAVLSANDKGADSVLSRADRALYRAKKLGRNRVEVAEEGFDKG